jgi:hypothetical protein
VTHGEGLNSIKTVLAYVEQQRKVTARLLLFRCWHDLAAKKRKEAQKELPITNFLKNKLHLQIYVMLNSIFVCEIFSFGAIAYFFL